jgi:hypothetical protein
MFKLWSQTNIKARELLTPNLSVRSLSDCEEKDRKIILQNFLNKGWFTDLSHQPYVHNAVRKFSDANKANNFCPKTLNHGGPHFYASSVQDCCKGCTHEDFWNIFLNMPKEISYELISYYVNELDNSDYYQHRNKFSNCFNDISDQFALDIIMVEDQFIPKQEEKIVNEIYKPVLGYLSNNKWEKVNNLMSDAFVNYRQNTPQGYSSCITHTISSVQAFLQILVDGKIGGSDGIKNLIKQAQEKGLIPDDKFTGEIFKNIEAVLMRERGKTGDAHPKAEYATEKNARTMLNLAMIFFQHCIQK